MFAFATGGCDRGRGHGLGSDCGLGGGPGRDRYYHYCQKENNLSEKF